ncbi:uncharacterized protein [Pyrus communis]|uniref:uncharacterized protein n=1 Tax=Pyrus communis TaxID=23211 RepID=UPI0035BFAF80
MSNTVESKSRCCVYIGNLEERVSERAVYDILIQAGRVVDLHIPRDKETDRPKGYAFAEYESEEIAEYAVRLFAGLVILYNRTLKFSISGQHKKPLHAADFVTTTISNFSHTRKLSYSSPVCNSRSSRCETSTTILSQFHNLHGSTYDVFSHKRLRCN